MAKKNKANNLNSNAQYRRMMKKLNGEHVKANPVDLKQNVAPRGYRKEDNVATASVVAPQVEVAAAVAPNSVLQNFAPGSAVETILSAGTVYNSAVAAQEVEMVAPQAVEQLAPKAVPAVSQAKINADANALIELMNNEHEWSNDQTTDAMKRITSYPDLDSFNQLLNILEAAELQQKVNAVEEENDEPTPFTDMVALSPGEKGPAEFWLALVNEKVTHDVVVAAQSQVLSLMADSYIVNELKWQDLAQAMNEDLQAQKAEAKAQAEAQATAEPEQLNLTNEVEVFDEAPQAEKAQRPGIGARISAFAGAAMTWAGRQINSTFGKKETLSVNQEAAPAMAFAAPKKSLAASAKHFLQKNMIGIIAVGATAITTLAAMQFSGNQDKDAPNSALGHKKTTTKAMTGDDFMANISNSVHTYHYTGTPDTVAAAQEVEQEAPKAETQKVEAKQQRYVASEAVQDVVLEDSIILADAEEIEAVQDNGLGFSDFEAEYKAIEEAQTKGHDTSRVQVAELEEMPITFTVREIIKEPGMYTVTPSKMDRVYTMNLDLDSTSTSTATGSKFFSKVGQTMTSTVDAIRESKVLENTGHKVDAVKDSVSNNETVNKFAEGAVDIVQDAGKGIGKGIKKLFQKKSHDDVSTSTSKYGIAPR